MKWNLKKGMGPLFVVGGGSLILFATLSLLMLARATSLWNEIGHTYDVLAQVTGLAVDLPRAESRQKAYLLTHDNAERVASESAIRSLSAELRMLQVFALERRELSSSLAALEPVLAERLKRMEKTIRLESSGHHSQALALVSSGEGQRLSDRASSLVSEVLTRERVRLSGSSREARRLEDWSRGIALGVAVTTFVLTILSIWLLNRQFGAKDRIEAALRESEEKFRALVQGVKDYAIILLDPTGKVVSWNDGARRMKGYTEREILGRHFSLFYPEEVVKEGFPQHALEIAKEKGRFEDEGWRIRKDGSKFWANVIIAALRNPRGDLLGYAKVTRDVTERRLAQQKLAHQTDELKRNLEYLSLVHDSIIVRDQKDTIVYWNPAAERNYGWSKEEAVGRISHELFQTDFPEPLSEIEKTLEQTGTWQGELEHRRKDGSRITVASRWTRRSNADGHPAGVLEINNDVTSKKKTEKRLSEAHQRLQRQQEELQQMNEKLAQRTQALEQQSAILKTKNADLTRAKEEFEKISRYKSEFLANMSHELRTPLNSILLLSSLLEENRAKTLTPGQVEYVKTIRTSGTDLINIINDILDLAKIEAGKLRLTEAPILLEELRTKLEHSFQAIAETKRLRWRVEMEPGLPAQISSDMVRVEQILRNLLSNAFKFTNQGEITLRFSPDGNGGVAISVHDTGIGISPKDQRLIFEAFQQADSGTSRKYGGTGLGLTISRELAEKLGGEITVRSKEREGSTFTLRLPERMSEHQRVTAASLNPEHRPASSEPSVPAAFQRPAPPTVPDDRLTLSSGDKIILIVEDDRTFAENLLGLMHRYGYKGIIASDGLSGLELAKLEAPHAILLDLRLPGVDGITVLEHLKKHPQTCHIPVQVLSAYEDEGVRSLGAVGFLRKPVTEQALRDAMTHVEKEFHKPVRRILLVEDDAATRKALLDVLSSEILHVQTVETVEAAQESLRQSPVDCLVLDLGLPDGTGFELLKNLSANALSIPPLIVYTAKELTPDEELVLKGYSARVLSKRTTIPSRVLDEIARFLTGLERELPEEKRKLLAQHREESLGGKRVLLVDDDMRNVYALTKTLEDRGLEVVIGKNGKEAIQALEKNAGIDLVLMDIMMPEMDGYQAMHIIRQNDRYKALPIIALTAKAMPEDRARCIESGANDYLAKPVQTSQLVNLLQVWLLRGAP